MPDAVATVFPLFAIVTAGYAAARFRWIGPGAGAGLSEYVYLLAIPVLLFRTLATASASDADPTLYWAAYFIGVAVVWLLAGLLSRRVFGLSGALSAIAGFATGQANTVLMGIPLIVRTFGDRGAVPLFLLVAIHLPVTMTVATLLVERTLGGRAGPRRVLWRLVSHPILIGIAAGLAIRLLAAPLPEAVLATTRLIGDSASPCALFAMGTALARYGLGADRRLLMLIAVLKLGVHPAIVYALAAWAFALPPVWVGVAVLFAACPSGVNAYLLAERYKVGVGLSSGAISATTALSPLTTTFWVWLVTR